jgi:hypothetical protein
MSETYKNPEVDPAKDLHEEFADVSPRSSDQTRGRIGRIHPEDPEYDRPFKIPADVFLEDVVKKREEGSSPDLYGLILGEWKHAYFRDKLEDKYKNDPQYRDVYFEDAKNDFIEDLQRVKQYRGGSFNEFASSRLISELLTMGYIVDPNIPEAEQAISILKNMTPEEFRKYLKLHVKTEKRRSRKISAEFEVHKSEFIDNMSEAYRSGRLPASFDLEKAKRRLLQTNLISQDMLNSYGVNASYSSDSHSIFMMGIEESEEQMASDFLPEEYRKRAYSHEGVHAIAGKTIVQEADREVDYVNFPAPNDPVVVKRGLAFSFSRRMKHDNLGWTFYRFEWLDEACTETENTKIRNIAEPEARKKEIKLYKLLKEKGRIDLPEELFEDAYYEDFDPSAPAGQRLPKWKKLRRSINEAYDRRFLTELDDFILAYEYEGLDKAIEFLEGLEKGDYGQGSKSLQDIRKEKAIALGLPPNSSWYFIAKVEPMHEELN